MFNWHLIFILHIEFVCLQLSEVSALIEFQHYDGITLSNCGLVRIPNTTTKNCFKWYRKAAEDQLSAIGTNGRYALKDEFPWIAFLSIRGRTQCTAILLNEKWMITAAHCIQTTEQTSNYEVIFRTHREYGTFRVNKSIRHLEYSREYPQNDIGLLKLAEDVPIEPKADGRYQYNGLCLPPDNYFSRRSGLAIVSGWGVIRDRDRPNRLRAGVVSVNRFRDRFVPNTCVEDSQIVCACNDTKHAELMLGDSGAPWMQYADDGRAVALGVHFGNYPGHEWRCVCGDLSVEICWLD